VATGRSRLLALALMGLVYSVACSSSGARGPGLTPTGGAGGGGAGGAGASGGSGGSPTGGNQGTGGMLPGNTGGTPADAGGVGDSGGSPVGDGGGAVDGPASGPARVLLYTKRSTPTHDASIPVATKTLTDLFKTISFEVDASEMTTVFTAANLARYSAVIMVNSNGTPFGTPGTAEAMALLEYVRGGGGFAAFHAAGNTSYPAGHPFIALLGATFQNIGGGVRNVSCAPEPQQPVVAKVPNPLPAPGDEAYIFGGLNPMNKLVLRCDPDMGTTKVQASWIRDEGAGRVFYTTLGHGPPSWQADSPVVTTHAWPGILWALRRAD
jgi:type 1 glutamine amidotransferase